LKKAVCGLEIRQYEPEDLPIADGKKVSVSTVKKSLIYGSRKIEASATSETFRSEAGIRRGG